MRQPLCLVYFLLLFVYLSVSMHGMIGQLCGPYFTVQPELNLKIVSVPCA